MNNKLPVVAIVGVLSGFVLGFFVAQVVLRQDQGSLSQQRPPASAAGDALPQNHPPEEVLQALERLQQQAQNHPEDSEVRVVLGNIYYDMRRFDAAVRWYEEALALDPQNIGVNTDLGTAYFYLGDSGKALQQFDQSLKINPDHPETLINLGVVNASIGNYTEAIGAWEKLVDRHPEHPQAGELKTQIERIRAEILAGKS